MLGEGLKCWWEKEMVHAVVRMVGEFRRAVRGGYEDGNSGGADGSGEEG